MTSVYAIVQARTGSKRLPCKVLVPFFEQQSILDVVLEALHRVLPKKNVVIATTLEPADSAIAAKARDHGVRCCRGSTTDVLGRFVQAIQTVGAESVFRICADNPFLRKEYLAQLLDEYQTGDYDYVSYAFPDGTPVMRSHIGLFAEILSAQVLERVAAVATAPHFREHVTPYLYEHLDDFRVKFLPVPDIIARRREIRLTVDTPRDFETLSALFSGLAHGNREFPLEALLTAIDSNPRVLAMMKEEIAANEK